MLHIMFLISEFVTVTLAALGLYVGVVMFREENKVVGGIIIVLSCLVALIPVYILAVFG